MRHLALVLSLLTLFTFAGCKSQCRQLSEKLCECLTSQSDQQTCVQRAQTAEAAHPSSTESEKTCKALLTKCDCNLATTTAEGKKNCGLAR